MNYRNRIIELLADFTNIAADKLSKFLKEANKKIDADFAINCFALRQFLGKDGMKIAQELKQEFDEADLSKYRFLDVPTQAGPYLNFKIDKSILAEEVIGQVLDDVDHYVKDNFESADPERMVIEYPSPNTNKPLHLGHVRNMLLGQSISILSDYIGNQVFQVNLLNDRGVHICKSMWAYDNFGAGKTPEQEDIKPDHFVGKYYVKYAQVEKELKNKIKDKFERLEKEETKPPGERDEALLRQLGEEIDGSKYGQLQDKINEMLVKWEDNDPEVRALWEKMNSWAKEGYNQTFELFQIEHDKTYLESNIYDKGKDIVKDGVERGIFEQLPDGAVVAKFNKKSLPKQKVLLRNDGTTLYVTQDLYLAEQKMKDFDYDLSIYVIGNEQDMQLRTVFELLDMIGMKGNNLHYSYGMINLTTGRMKSREGTVVDADDLVLELSNLAKNEISKRYQDLSKSEIERRAHIIGMAALRFFILKYEYTRDFLFDAEESISFEGETGPYILYAYARICSVFNKGLEDGIPVPYNPQEGIKGSDFDFDDIDYSMLNSEEEISVIDRLYRYPSVLFDAAKNLKPHLLTRELYDLAQEFNVFYHKCRILGEKKTIQDARLILCEAVRQVLKNGLGLLKIDVLNEM